CTSSSTVRSRRSGMPARIMSNAATDMMPATNTAPTASAQAAISTSLEMAARLSVALTNSEDRTLTLRERSCARMMSDPPRRAAPGRGAKGGCARGKNRPRPRARGGPPLARPADGRARPHAAPPRPEDHARRDHQVDDLLQLSYAELELDQNTTVDAPHDHE